MENGQAKRARRGGIGLPRLLAALALALACVFWVAAAANVAYAVPEAPGGDPAVAAPAKDASGAGDECQVIEDLEVPLSMWEEANASHGGGFSDYAPVAAGAVVVGGIIAFGLLRSKNRSNDR